MWLWRELHGSFGSLERLWCLYTLKNHEVILIILNYVGMIALDEDDVFLRFFVVCVFEGTGVVWLEWALKSAQVFPRILTGSWGENHCASDHGHPQSLPPVVISIGFWCSQNHGTEVFRRICKDKLFAVNLNLGVVAKWHGCWTSSGRE